MLQHGHFVDPQQHNTLSLQDHSSMGSGTMLLEADLQTSGPLRPICRCIIHNRKEAIAACTRPSLAKLRSLMLDQVETTRVHGLQSSGEEQQGFRV